MTGITRTALLATLFGVAACATPERETSNQAQQSAAAAGDGDQAGPARDSAAGIGETRALVLSAEPNAIRDSGNYGAHTTPGLTSDASGFERKCKPYCT
ncbi:MAG: hypothetical protein AAGA26_08220 [Pseudomonadota bacterium]